MEQTTSEMIRQSWALVAANPALPQMFYANLFRLDPSTKPLFVGDLERQGRKLTDTLSFIVDNLEQAEILVPAAEDLARRHVTYGVTKDQYASVGSALLLTLSQLLGAVFSRAAEAAWVETYANLSELMIDAAYGPG